MGGGGGMGVYEVRYGSAQVAGEKKDMDLLLLGDAQKTATVPRLPPAPTPVKKNSI